MGNYFWFTIYFPGVECPVFDSSGEIIFRLPRIPATFGPSELKGLYDEECYE